MLARLKRIGIIGLLSLGVSFPAYAETPHPTPDSEQGYEQKIQALIHEKGMPKEYSPPKTIAGEHSLKIQFEHSEKRIRAQVSRALKTKGRYTLELVDFPDENKNYGTIDEFTFYYRDISSKTDTINLTETKKAPFDKEQYAHLEEIYIRILNRAYEQTCLLTKDDFKTFDKFCYEYLDSFAQQNSKKSKIFGTQISGELKLKKPLKEILGKLDDSIQRAKKGVAKFNAKLKSPKSNGTSSLLGLLRFIP